MNKNDVEALGGNGSFASIIGVSPSRAVQIFYTKENKGRNGALTYDQAKKVLAKTNKFTLEHLLEEQD